MSRYGTARRQEAALTAARRLECSRKRHRERKALRAAAGFPSDVSAMCRPCPGLSVTSHESFSIAVTHRGIGF